MSEPLNIDIIKKSIKEIYDKTLKDLNIKEITEKDKKEFTKTLYFNIINSCLGYQYKLLKDNLYDRVILNQKMKDISGVELFNHFYKHQFTHCYIAFIDEYYEVDEAKFLLSKKTNKDAFKEQSDIIEEAIDLFHFILQFGVMITELKCVKKMIDSKDIENFNVENLNSILKNENLVKFVETSLNLLASNISGVYNNERINSSGDILYKARNMIRKINWKDWKSYKEDHYNYDTISIIKEDILGIFDNFIKCFFDDCIKNVEYYCFNRDVTDPVSFWNEIFDTNIIKLSEVDKLLLIYGIYIAKNYVNIERQRNGY